MIKNWQEPLLGSSWRRLLRLVFLSVSQAALPHQENTAPGVNNQGLEFRKKTTKLAKTEVQEAPLPRICLEMYKI